MGRGILDRGRWAEPHETGGRPLPVTRRLSCRSTSRLGAQPLHDPGVQHAGIIGSTSSARARAAPPGRFFYPLDAILHWNRIYGRRGFTQYQCVLPDSAGKGAARRFLELLTSRGGASFLCVIKDCGAQGQGLLSFLRPGISIALDIPVRDDTQQLVDTLNELVIAEGGRIYLAKDAFTRPEHYAAMDPRRGPNFRPCATAGTRRGDPLGAVGAGPRRPALSHRPRGSCYGSSS
jgi:decaprenylphospho-beta-D-ribofuranose 2-oxidase